jgi:hypothetical protein
MTMSKDSTKASRRIREVKFSFLNTGGLVHRVLSGAAELTRTVRPTLVPDMAFTCLALMFFIGRHLFLFVFLLLLLFLFVFLLLLFLFLFVFLLLLLLFLENLQSV